MNKRAKAAIFSGVNIPFEIREYETSAAPSGYAVMSLIASGICGTDVHIHKGRLFTTPGTIIGHEFVGKIEDINPGSTGDRGLKTGDNVIVDIAVPCGKCLLCKNGDDANCVNMQVTNGGDPTVAPHFWGGFAEMNVTPITNLIKIPEGIDPKTACVFACAGPTALHAFSLARRAGIKLESVDTAVVQGLGPVGTFAVMYLASLGIKNVIAVTAGNNPRREELARELGATEVLNLERTPAAEITKHIQSFNGGLGADVVFEASGSPKAVPQGMEMLRNRGTYLIPGQYSNSGAVEIQPQLITFKALQLIGSSQYSLCDVDTYISFLISNPQLHEKILSLASCYKVEDINEAMEDAKSGKNIKTMLVR